MGSSLLLVLIFALSMGVPVAFAMGIVSLFYFVYSGDFSFMTIPQKVVTGMDSFLYLAIPFFLLAGALMNHGGITARLIDFASALVGHIYGGLGQVTVLANVIMAGMSGTATADAVATGSVLIPAMTKRGYSPGFAAAISASAATIGPIIPPSVAFVIFGSLTNVSIGQLFLAGVVPGLMMGLYLMVTCYIIARRRGYGAEHPRKSLDEIWSTFKRAVPAMLTPVLVLGGMIGGVFTATEAAAVAALYSFILGIAYGALDWRRMGHVVNEVVVMTAAVYLLLGVFNLFGWILAVEQIPQKFASYFLAMTSEVYVALLLINIVLLLLGIFIEPVPLMVILGPMLIGIATSYGVDPVHFGIIFVLNIMIGIITPPIGINMFIACNIAQCSILEFTRESAPFIGALVLLLLVVTYVPQISLWLPRLFF